MIPRRAVLCALLCALAPGGVNARCLPGILQADSTAPAGGRTVHAEKAPAPPPAESLHTARPEQRSATTAVLLSAALPGAGQVYNGSTWKAPLVLGLGIYFVAEAAGNHRKYRTYRDQYTASQTAGNPAGDLYLLRLRDFYSSSRDSFVWYFVILYVLNLVDAYVDASLSGFDVGGDLSFRPLPAPSVQLRLRIP